MKRRNFFASLLAAPAIALVAAPQAEAASELRLADHPGDVRDFLIKAAFVRTGILASGETLDAATLAHWRKHLALCADFDELTAHVASSFGVVWPLVYRQEIMYIPSNITTTHKIPSYTLTVT